MKIEINGIKREVQIMPAPSKCFCIFEECCTPSYPIYVGICEAITKEEVECGNILICPICSNNGGYEDVSAPAEVKNNVGVYDIVTLYKNNRIYGGYDSDSKEDLLSYIIEDFEANGFKITDNVIKGARREIEDFEKSRTE